MITDYQWIDDNSELEQLLFSIKTNDAIAFDSEFERVNTFYPKPALFQLRIVDDYYLIDMTKITDYKVFVKLLDNIILHSGSEDLEILLNLNDKLPTTIFDTQIAASLCGYGLHFSYQNSVSELLGVELSKAHSRSDWMRRPLSSDQLQYALDDVVYLPELKALLFEKLELLGRLSWYEKLMKQKVNSIVSANHVDTTFIKIAKSKKLTQDQQKLLYSLLQWREKIAIKRDKPRPWILKNHEAFTIALKQPKSNKELIDDVGLYPKFVEYNAKNIFALYKDSQQLDLTVLPKFGNLSPQQGVLYKELKQELVKKCEKLKIPTALIINTADLKSLVADDKDLNNVDMWQLISQ